MRLCNNRLVLLVLSLVFCPLAMKAQAPAPSSARPALPAPAPQQQSVPTLAAPAPAPPPTQTLPSPTTPEQQPPLTVDRDPVVSPDVVDNQPVSPSNPNPVKTTRRDANGGYTFHQDVDEVVLYASVFDENNRIVNDLKQDDFHVFEDGVQQTIAAFQHQDIPVSMGILVDNSGSMRDKRQAVSSAALDLVKASNPEDESFVVNFSDEAFIDQDFTSDLKKLRDALSRIDSKGGTALYDAVVASADQLAKGAKRPKQVLLVVTDGEDNASSLNLEQTIRRVQNLQGPVVYTIGLLFGDEGGRASRRAKRALELMSSETGGQAYFPKSLSEVDQICAEVARDIRNQYTLGYHSTRPASEGGYRIVKIVAHAPKHGKLNVRARSGYYPKATPAAEDKSAPAPK